MVPGLSPRMREAAMLDRAFWRWVCIVAALILSLLWLFSVVAGGFSAPPWVAPSSVVALAVAAVLFAALP
jgi:apolipoprotein N-acyltransferase